MKARCRVPPRTTSLGPLLRGYRHAAGMTLEELAERAGVSARAIGDMERGRSRGPQARTMEALADALALEGADRAALLVAARAGRRRPKDPAPGLCDLPPDIPDFVGRDKERAWLARAGDSPGGPRVAIVSGGPGLGKSALAVHAAWQVAERYGDGRFFIDLRGLDAEPVAPHQALSRLLKALGIREKEIPADTDERRALYGRLMRDRRVLVVLDNAVGEAQLRPLLPGPGRSTVWVTSRRALTGIEHAARLPLGPLPAAAATSMLGTIISSHSVIINTPHVSIVGGRDDDGAATDDTPDEAADDTTDDTAHGTTDDTALREIADRCGHLPLALRIAANRLLSRPSWSPRDLADRLAAEDLRLDRLTAGDLHIQSAFTLSYAQLTPELKLLFRRLALVPGPDFGSALGAVLTGLPEPRTEQLTDELVELGLLVPTTGDRAAFHDLIRLYANKRLHDEESPEDTRAAGTRMNDWLLATARAAGQWFEPDKPHDPAPHDPDAPGASAQHGDGEPSDASSAAATPPTGLHSQQAAREWLEDEGHNWFAAFRAASQEGRHTTVVAVAEAMHWFSDWWIFWGHWPEVFARSHAAAHALGDTRTEAVHLNYLAWSLQVCLGDAAGSEIRALEAERLARQAGDRAQQAWALLYAAHAAAALQRPEDALAYGERAAELFREAGDKEGHPQALLGTAHDLTTLRRPHEALDRLRHVLALVTDPASAPAPHIADYAVANTLRAIGTTHAGLGDWAQAVTAYRQALETGPRVGVPNLRALILHGLARALYQQREYAQARPALAEARDLFHASGNAAKAAEAEAELSDWGPPDRHDG
ncbi:helix-turn-helix domain-containing protein [Streptomyces avermitilis]|uniref:helix-turn-helix domain-containing protein n=1 Tax=Streptomyces avermitilis TaxID=33903 RepID=UPI0033ACA367